MIVENSIPASHPLAKRLDALGLALMQIDAHGKATPLGSPPWFGNILIQSEPMQRVLATKLEEIREASGCVLLGSGVYVASLAAKTGDIDVQWAALLLTPEIYHSEMLHQVCGQAGLDVEATRSRIDPQSLVDEAQLQRLVQTLGWMGQDLQSLSTQRKEMRHLSEELAGNYEELSLLYRLSCSMSLDQPAVDFFSNACEELQEVSGLSWIALHIAENQPRLQELRGALYAAGVTDQSKPVGQLGRELMQHFQGRADTIIIDDTRELGGVAHQVSEQLLVVPLVREGQTLGVLFGGDRQDNDFIDSVDAKLCASLCNTLAVFLENLMFLEDAQSLFIGTLHALTAAIDAKDSYTRGHSERVALLSKMLAKAADIDEETVERIYIAGLIHDVGKIGVPEAVLCKPGRLTEGEFEFIKMHPAIGANMLRDIRQMDDLIPGVLYHHEHWDGQGYPEQRAGHDIPLFGRVIGLADAFDAMSSNRTYRSALDQSQVLAEIERCRGTQFDPQLADVFLTLDLKPYYDLIEQHRAAVISDCRDIA